ncbi:universal stress protein [Cylindrospermum sp. FACHB-282]|uniref:universal stress protein n=1 Tax=Cylindrospermum sp. FACHB-282 TaxID=2692794 RepID=UPI001685B5B4|nr:universal stress protein [Cylindrospermum sp. FACHB-282]MBD2386068.1 universal stress protein [Cylindrospermum sp. FACHB-282]
MFNKILVALDRSEMGQQIFEQGLALAKVTAASLILVHILSPEEEGSPDLPILSNFDYYPGLTAQTFELYQQNWEAFKTKSLQMLQFWAAQANTAGINTEFRQSYGSPGRIICDIARSSGADLIVMGRRGRTGLAEIFLGSVSNYVLHHAPCSVHIVHIPVSATANEVVKEDTINPGAA